MDDDDFFELCGLTPEDIVDVVDDGEGHGEVRKEVTGINTRLPPSTLPFYAHNATLLRSTYIPEYPRDPTEEEDELVETKEELSLPLTYRSMANSAQTKYAGVNRSNKVLLYSSWLSHQTVFDDFRFANERFLEVRSHSHLFPLTTC